MKAASQYILAYLLWALTTALIVVAALLVRNALIGSLTMATIAGLDMNAPGAFDTSMRLRTMGAWSYPILGIILVVLVVFLEHYYRTALSILQLLARFVRVAAFTVIALFVGHLILFLTSHSLGTMGWSGALLPAAELAAAALLFGLSAWLRGRSNGPTSA
ncbi:MAG: hypothetical protein BWY52_01439 [Chloroflexi bacterium ADurb.Bin325]|nr:MAG: hypothetical protein BWY52_01439 [Chloroflexi bacterium ADurb.Bin325]